MGWPSFSASAGAITRPSTSMPLPAANGITMVAGRTGHPSAAAPPAGTAAQVNECRHNTDETAMKAHAPLLAWVETHRRGYRLKGAAASCYCSILPYRT